jgi:dihydrofolate synthase/folylpolyglutamate synthase
MKIWRVPYPKYGAGPDLGRVSKIAAALGVDLTRFGANGALITGSNGKGSTAAMCASILSEIAPAGLFTSPHLLSLKERFRIGGDDISDTELETHWARVASAAKQSGESENLRGFEFLFLIAADWFTARGCRFIVWEAGIGGRDDPTRLIQPRRTALTSLELEHAALIGPTLEDIARNKLDAAPPGAHVFVGENCAPLRSLIEAHSALKSVSPIWIAPDIHAPLPLAGAFQRGNAALAIAVAKHMAADALTEGAIRRGLAGANWPGRLETLQRDPLVVIDVGHTPDGVRAAFAGFAELARDRRRTLVCGVSADKAAAPIVGALAPHFSRIICASARHKGAAAADIAQLAMRANAAAEISVAETVEDARRLAVRDAGKGGAVYVAGGLFLAAEFKAAHLGLDPAALAFF